MIPRLVGLCVIKRASVFNVGEHALLFGKKKKCSFTFVEVF